MDTKKGQMEIDRDETHEILDTVLFSCQISDAV